MSNRTSKQKGHIQPHYTHLPRRQPRSRPPLERTSHPNAMGIIHTVSQPMGQFPRTRNPHVGLDSYSIPTESTASASFGDIVDPSHGLRDDATPLTSPSEIILPFDTLPQKFPIHPLSQPRIVPAEAGSRPHPQSHIHPPADIRDMDKIYRSLGRAQVRGHLEPRLGNLPRRRRLTHTEKQRIDRRHLQELFKGSGVWVAFNPSSSAGGGGRSSQKLGHEGASESDWKWEERLGFTAVIRVRLGEVHGECRNEMRDQGKREVLELIIGEEQIKIHDATGVSTLSHDQLRVAAIFLADNRQREDGPGKVLVTVPASWPVEALSIALLGLSLPPPSLPILPSFLSQMRFLPGVVDLEQAQEAQISEYLELGVQEFLTRYTTIQLALWHLHDIAPPDDANDDHNELKLEWRGALSIDGVEKLENLACQRDQ